MIPGKKIFLYLLLAGVLFGFPLAQLQAEDPSPEIRHILRSASELDYPPFAIMRLDGSADGFSVALLNAVVKNVGLDIAFNVGPWAQIKQQLIDGKLDVLPLVSYSPERDQVLDFTTPYLRMRGSIFVRKEDRGTITKTNIKDKEVIVMRGDTAHEYAVKTHLSNHLILTDSFEEAMRMLAAGQHDAVVIQQLVGLELVKRLQLKNIVSIDLIQEKNIRPSGDPLNGFEQKFCFAVKQGDAPLLARLNEGLAIAVSDGTYNALYEEWFGPILPSTPISLAKLVWMITAVAVPVLMILLAFGIWYLKREVARKTFDLRQGIQQREKTQAEKEALIVELQKAIADVKTLSGLLPICASCKKIRDDKGYWNQIETYIKDRSHAEFTHGICPDCARELYPGFDPDKTKS